MQCTADLCCTYHMFPVQHAKCLEVSLAKFPGLIVLLSSDGGACHCLDLLGASVSTRESKRSRTPTSFTCVAKLCYTTVSSYWSVDSGLAGAESFTSLAVIRATAGAEPSSA